MELTTAEKNGVKIMAEIAKNDGECVSITDIATHQGISVKYVEKIVAGLKKANLVQSTRGVLGGYTLAKDANQISIREILRASGDKLELVKCVNADCPHKSECETKQIWQNLNTLINDYLENISLQQLLNQNF